MSAETMLHFLNNCTPEEKFGFRVVTQCAPVLKGVKISNLITMKPGGWRKIRWVFCSDIQWAMCRALLITVGKTA